MPLKRRECRLHFGRKSVAAVAATDDACDREASATLFDFLPERTAIQLIQWTQISQQTGSPMLNPSSRVMRVV